MSIGSLMWLGVLCFQCCREPPTHVMSECLAGRLMTECKAFIYSIPSLTHTWTNMTPSPILHLHPSHYWLEALLINYQTLQISTSVIGAAGSIAIAMGPLGQSASCLHPHFGLLQQQTSLASPDGQAAILVPKMNLFLAVLGWYTLS